MWPLAAAGVRGAGRGRARSVAIAVASLVACIVLSRDSAASRVLPAAHRASGSCSAGAMLVSAAAAAGRWRAAASAAGRAGDRPRLRALPTRAALPRRVRARCRRWARPADRRRARRRGQPPARAPGRGLGRPDQLPAVPVALAAARVRADPQRLRPAGRVADDRRARPDVGAGHAHLPRDRAADPAPARCPVARIAGAFASLLVVAGTAGRRPTTGRPPRRATSASPTSTPMATRSTPTRRCARPATSTTRGRSAARRDRSGLHPGGHRAGQVPALGRLARAGALVRLRPRRGARHAGADRGERCPARLDDLTPDAIEPVACRAANRAAREYIRSIARSASSSRSARATRAPTGGRSRASCARTAASWCWSARRRSGCLRCRCATRQVQDTRPRYLADGLDATILRTNAKLRAAYPAGGEVRFVSLIDALCNPQGCLAMTDSSRSAATAGARLRPPDAGRLADRRPAAVHAAAALTASRPSPAPRRRTLAA